MMNEKLTQRSGSKCELCGHTDNLETYEIAPNFDGSVDQSIAVCETCHSQIGESGQMDTNHWRCLNDSMWSQVPAVQVMAWRILSRLQSASWAQDLLAMLYLKEETLAWAQAIEAPENVDHSPAHFDSNGAKLNSGDTITLIKDLNVKGAGFTAKRGTAVRGISLVIDNPEHIEGRINGQQIVILTKFVKKSG